MKKERLKILNSQWLIKCASQGYAQVVEGQNFWGVPPWPTKAEIHNHFLVAVPPAWLCIPVNTADSVLWWEGGENKAGGSNKLCIISGWAFSLEFLRGRIKILPGGNRYLPTCHKTRQTDNDKEKAIIGHAFFFLVSCGNTLCSLIKTGYRPGTRNRLFIRDWSLLPVPLICPGPLFFSSVIVIRNVETPFELLSP